MPISPELLTEYSALTSGAGFVDLSGRTLIEVTGADRVQLLHSFTTGDVKKLAEGRGCEAFITSPQGKTLGHVLIIHRGQSLLMITAAGQAKKLIDHFDRYVISEDVQLADSTDRLGLLLVAGADAEDLLRKVAAADLPSDVMSLTNVVIAGCPVAIARVQYVLPLAYFLLVKRAALRMVAQALTAAGAAVCGQEAAEMARIEAGVPLFGQDIIDDNLPQEIGRNAQAISFTKGCYLGQETVARIDALGHVNRQLVGVQFAGESVPLPATALLADGKEIGQVTSSAWSPRLAAPLAIALVRRAQSKAGTKLASSAGEGTVISLPVANSA